MKDLTHFDSGGAPRMVDVTGKDITFREAEAFGRVFVNAETLSMIKSGGVKKGDVLNAARLAGIMGAKRTSDIVPLCHIVPITGVSVDASINEDGPSVDIRALVRCADRTGVEMEALTAVSAAALCIYDMCKAVQRDMVIGEICLLRKSGGRSGIFDRGAGE